MSKIKEFIVNNISKNILAYMLLVMKYNRKSKNLIKTAFFALEVCFKKYTPSKNWGKGKQIRKLFNKVKIKINQEDRYVYNIDLFKTTSRKNLVIDNMTVDYSKILNNSLNDFTKINNQLTNGEYKTNQKDVILGIGEYIDRECEEIRKSDRADKEKIIQYLMNIKDKKAVSFDESIQRILFFNQLLWQVGHNLNGLGRLDKILEKSYNYDKKNKGLTKDKAKEMIKDMAKILNKYFWFKSSALMGDTGQIIILGGKEIDGSYFCNELTYMFIEAIEELQLPDPKVFLRVTDQVPRDLMELSLRCIKTGIGSPLFSNDDVIIPKLIEFGYDEEDAYNYVTAACWEPLIAGKSVERNNIDTFVYMQPFYEMLENENLDKINSLEELMKDYKKYLEKYINNFVQHLDGIDWEEAPLLSMIVDGCNEKLMDVSLGGAMYNNYGVTSVSLGSVVNSIFNINKFVFQEKKYTLSELNEYRKNNFTNNDELRNKLKNQPKRYGTENDEIINLTNTITGFINDILKNKKNKFGGEIKFGFSAPTYIMQSIDAPASFDGRKNGEPFGVHISSDKASVPYTELIQFATKLKYDGHRFNGNVIDFMITPNFIEDNFDKMVDFIILSISLGFFQMQMNVTSSDILIKAKANPREYENLIVRVWGFSAYFIDLPDNYKDLLIERALKNEGKSI